MQFLPDTIPSFLPDTDTGLQLNDALLHDQHIYASL